MEIVYGVHPVREVLRANRRTVFTIHYATDSEQRLSEILQLAKSGKVALRPTGKKELGKLADGAVHQGVVAEVAPIMFLDIYEFIAKCAGSGEKPVIAVLDSIVDPHNFGAILRSAEVFGVAGVIFPKERSAEINSTVVKTSAGATEYLDFCRVTNIARTVDELKENGFYVVSADADGEENLASITPRYPMAVVLGSEESGVRPLVKKSCDGMLRIDVKGKVDSLNVSTAAAVIFYQLTR